MISKFVMHAASGDDRGDKKRKRITGRKTT